MLATGANDGAELHDSPTQKVSSASQTLLCLLWRMFRVSLLSSESTSLVSHRFARLSAVTTRHFPSPFVDGVSQKGSEK